MEISIRDILARNPTPGIREAHIRQTVAEAITELTGVTVTPGQIDHIEGKLTLSVPPVLKSALYLRLEEFKNRLQEDGIGLVEVR